MNEQLQKKLDEMHLAAQRAAENLILQGNQLQAAQTRYQMAQTEAQAKTSEFQGAIRLLGWEACHWDGEHVQQGPLQSATGFATIPDQKGEAQ